MSDKQSVIVLIPTPLRRFTDGQAKLAIEATTLGELLDAIDREYPGIGERVRDESGQLRRFVNVFVNGSNVREGAGIETSLSAGDEVGIIPAMAGGSDR
ncbi:MAG: ubiquitin-like small modifier protein 1 [Thermomicrobiales bacterium]